MNEVSSQATRALLEAASAEGIEPERVLRGAPISPERLDDARSRIDWDAFATLCDNVAAACRGPEGLVRVGARLPTTPSYDIAARISEVLADARFVYELVARWIIPISFLNLHPKLTRRRDNRLLFIIEIPAGYRVSEAFFRITQGSFASTPALLGLPPAVVEVEIEERRCAYTITPPPPLPLPERVRRASRALFGMRAVFEEMTRQREELRQSYEDLLRIRSDFQGVIESIPDLVFIHRGGVIVWANEAAARCLGFQRPAELVGALALDLAHTDDRERLFARAQQPPAEQGGHAEFRLLRRDGDVVILEVAPAREIQFEGAPARLVVARDITERRRIQERLLLSDRLASLGTLAAGVAHEINNPLAYIYLNLEIAARELAGLADPRLQRAQGAIADALEGSARVRAIVGDLKTFARAGGDPVGPVDVHEILESVAALATREVRRRARLAREYGTIPPAQANRSRLGQVFLNLLLNAADAIPEGQPDQNEIRIRTFTDDAGRVAVEVSDTGAGIPEANLGRIFDPFFTTKPPGSGTGLGLAICHHIVRALGGEISASSVEGKGSTFRVVLPAADSAPQAARPDHPAPADRGERREPHLAGAASPPARAVARRPSGKPCVLIVDDEPALARSLEETLSELYDVTTVANGRAALDYITQGNDVDLILCDLMTSGMSGMELSAALAATHPQLRDRMLFMTGGAYTAEARRFLAAAPSRCLLKPFGAREVLEAIAEVLAASSGSWISGPKPQQSGEGAAGPPGPAEQDRREAPGEERDR